MSIIPEVQHGIAISVDEGRDKYFGWPSVAKLGDGTIVVGSSGLRAGHVCPWGKNVVAFSRDGGRTYCAPQVVHNDMIDNRDAGITALGGQRFAVTWFSLDVRVYDMHLVPEEYRQEAFDYMKTWDEDTVSSLVGAWTKITDDGGKTWSRAIRVPVSAPHGFSVLNDGKTLGYLGKRFREDMSGPAGDVTYCESDDGGCTWRIVGTVPVPDGVSRYHEPHVIQLDDGTLLGAIRYHGPEEKDDEHAGYEPDIVITRSVDGGKTWSDPERLYVAGLPPHLLKHSSGAIVMVYGYRHKGCGYRDAGYEHLHRHPGYGQRAVVSWNNGRTWSDEIVLRDDGYNFDLGYPASIELDDGSIYTVYYQAKPGVANTSVMWSRWKLPEK